MYLILKNKMRHIQKAHMATAVFVVGMLTPAVAFSESNADSAITGHIGIVSKYIVRGVTSTYGNSTPYGNKAADAPESDRPAVQWGLDWTHPSGWLFGYFGSTINYSYKQLGRLYDDPSVTDFQNSKSIENDLYGAYSGSWGDIGYIAGLTVYTYTPGKYSTGIESRLGLNYGPFSLTAETLLNDVTYGNRGDTYFSLAYSKALPMNITFTGTLGAYKYNKTGKFLGKNCAPGAYMAVFCSPGKAPVGSSLSHLTLGLSAPISDTNITLGIEAIIGGENRFGVEQRNSLVTSATYSF